MLRNSVFVLLREAAFWSPEVQQGFLPGVQWGRAANRECPRPVVEQPGAGAVPLKITTF